MVNITKGILKYVALSFYTNRLLLNTTKATRIPHKREALILFQKQHCKVNDARHDECCEILIAYFKKKDLELRMVSFKASV